jgi:predicted transcriptional regulator
MEGCQLAITLNPDWREAFRSVSKIVKHATCRVKILNFESPAAFSSRLTAERWVIVGILQKGGGMQLPQLARQVGQGMEHVQEDVGVLLELGMIERDQTGLLICPYADIYVERGNMPDSQVT